MKVRACTSNVLKAHIAYQVSDSDVWVPLATVAVSTHSHLISLPLISSFSLSRAVAYLLM